MHSGDPVTAFASGGLHPSELQLARDSAVGLRLGGSGESGRGTGTGGTAASDGKTVGSGESATLSSPAADRAAIPVPSSDRFRCRSESLQLSVHLPTFDRGSSFPLGKRLLEMLRQHVCLERALMHSAAVMGAYLRVQRAEEDEEDRDGDGDSWLGWEGATGGGGGRGGVDEGVDEGIEQRGQLLPGRRALVQATRRVLGLGPGEAQTVLEGFELSYDLLAGNPKHGATTAAELLRGPEEAV